MNNILVLVLIAAVLLAIVTLQESEAKSTVVSGHQKSDKDGNGIPDKNITVNGHYTAVYAYDGLGFWYWDLGDGRISGNVNGMDNLDSSTITQCDYVINYRGTFENDPSMDSGWIQNHIDCKGYDDNNHYNYLIVHETDPRYTGNPEWSIWNEWEYHTLTVSGFGNLVSPTVPP